MIQFDLNHVRVDCCGNQSDFSGEENEPTKLWCGLRFISLFVSSNNVTKHSDDTPGIGQLAAWCSCGMLQETLLSQRRTIEKKICRLMQVVGSVISMFEACF